jgi:hypothetical protein
MWAVTPDTEAMVAVGTKYPKVAGIVVLDHPPIEVVSPPNDFPMRGSSTLDMVDMEELDCSLPTTGTSTTVVGKNQGFPLGLDLKRAPTTVGMELSPTIGIQTVDASVLARFRNTTSFTA